MRNPVNAIVRKVLYGYKSTSKTYIDHLRKIGFEIGQDVYIYNPHITHIDETAPHLLTIGSHVRITGPVTILTHDYSWSVIKHKYGEICGKQKAVTIGDGVFVGWGATVLCGTTIGNNTIVGAQAVVSGKVDSDSVYAGNPAKKIMSLDEFYAKRKERQLAEAVAYANAYYARYGKEVPAQKLDEYFFLFSTSENCNLYRHKIGLMGNEAKTLEMLDSEKPPFGSYESFMDYCREQR